MPARQPQDAQSQEQFKRLVYVLEKCLESPYETTREGVEAANLVDGLFALARAIDNLANAVRGQGSRTSTG
jgi:hypothetical protein